MKKPNAQMQEILDTHGKLGPLPIESLSAENARQQPEVRDAVMGVLQNHFTKRVTSGVVIPVEKITHERIKTPAGEITARVYNPAPDAERLPVLLYFHGGGWVIASNNAYDASCRALATQAECIVVSVAYRQAPEHVFPAAHDDALESYKWLLKNAERLGGDLNRVAICGESAGGNLATSVCIRAKQEGIRLPIHQLLVYPVVDMDMNRPSYAENADAKPLNKPMMKWFFDYYFDKKTPTENWALPIKANLVGLPAATVIGAEIDPLCSEGQAYAQKLDSAGVETFYKLYEGVTHEFFGLGAVLDTAKQAMSDACEQLKLAFAPRKEDAAPVVWDPEASTGSSPMVP